MGRRTFVKWDVQEQPKAVGSHSTWFKMRVQCVFKSFFKKRRRGEEKNQVEI